MEFEAFPPTEDDFSGIRCLLQQVSREGGGVALWLSS